MKIFCRVTEDGLIPLYDSDMDEKRKLKTGSDVEVDIKNARNYEFHKRFFALIGLAFDNLNENLQKELHIYTKDDLLVKLKMDLHLYKVVRHEDHDCFVLDSISFEKMDQREFEKFYDRVAYRIINVYLKGVMYPQLEEELHRFL
ncbi:MAG: hypothetical protein H6Q13_3331 [Bacteroidetes bacterium]|nr:hypothetical protein [Bacteroidota bacterium]